jgi:beta-glucosidase
MDEPKQKHSHQTLEFPHDFLWGAATSAHQVEGQNVFSDWWKWEQEHQPPEKRSEMADDSYNRYEHDINLAKELQHNAHRLSIEWARIEPKEGEFDHHEIEHYKNELKYLKDNGFKVMLTLWHFTLPEWVSEKGGWENGKTVDYFIRFVNRIVPELKDYVDLWVTLNEPQVYILLGYILGTWPPQKKSNWATVTASWHLAQAHKKAYKAIHKLIPDAQVGAACNIASFDIFHRHSLRELIASWFLDVFSNHLFYIFTGIKTHDFLGLNYYFNNYISFNGESRIPKIVNVAVTKKDVSDMGWEIFPEGIFDVLMDFSDYHKPIYITENGLASTNDDRRCRFLIYYLKEVYHAIQTGADVRGYFHWSLLDNFEWADGFKPRFGLIEVDYATFNRIPRPSSRVYAEIIKSNGIPHYLMRFIGHTINAEEVLAMREFCPECNAASREGIITTGIGV